MRAIFGWILALLFVHVTFAQPHGVAWQAYENIHVEWGTYSFTDGQNVSGTDVNFAVGAYTNRPTGLPPYEGNDPWEQGEVQWVEVQMGGETIRRYDLRTFPHNQDFTKMCRIDSAHWEHGITISIKVRANILLKKANGAIVQYETTPWVEAKPKSYNIIQLLRNDDPVNQYIMQEVVNTARLFEWNYNVKPPGDAFYHETDLIAPLKLATVFFASTHGDPALYMDSHYPGYEDTHRITVAENETYCYTSRLSSIPEYNMVVMYSCKTVNEAMAFPISFHVLGEAGPIRAKAYLGFDENLWNSWSVPNPLGGEDVETYMYVHTQILVSKLRTGLTAAEAVAEANKESKIPDTFPMKVFGDSRATMRGVYLTQTEENSVPGEPSHSRWYYIPD